MWYLYAMAIDSTNTIKAGITERPAERRGENGRKYGNGSKDCKVVFCEALCTDRTVAESIESALMETLSKSLKRVDPLAQGPASERFFADKSVESIDFTFKVRKAKTVAVTLSKPIPEWNKDGRANNGRKLK